MKRIRLEFPLGWGENTNAFLPSRVHLKVTGSETKAYKDKGFTEELPKTEKKISLEIDVPEELQMIQVVPPGLGTPVDAISVDWCMDMADPNWKIPGLKKILIIFDDRVHEVAVIDERPDFEGWKAYTDIGGEGTWLFMKPWALEVYVFDTKAIAGFVWHSKLARSQG